MAKIINSRYIIHIFYLYLFIILLFIFMKNKYKNICNSLYIYILNPIEIKEGLFLFSSFIENNVVRLITYYTNNNIDSHNFYCFFGVKKLIRSKVISINYRGVDEKYYNLICTIPNNTNTSDYIILSNRKIYLFNNNITSNIHYNLLLCLTTMFSYNDTYRFIEFIEYYRHFGVDKFIVYNTNCSKQIEKIYKYYINIKLIDVIYDNISHNLYAKNKFQVWKQNDCFYRYKNSAKRIIFTDHDEIIYSPLYNNSADLFSHLNNEASSFHFFPKLIITYGKGFFANGYYSICPYGTWKFVINKSICILQVIVHDVISKKNKYCSKENVNIKSGYIIHARNQPSRHSKVCKNWIYESNYIYQKRVLTNLTNYISLDIFKTKKHI